MKTELFQALGVSVHVRNPQSAQSVGSARRSPEPHEGRAGLESQPPDTPTPPPGDDSMRTSQLNVGTSTDVSLKITESDLSLLTASIRAPSGNEEPCLLKRLPNRHIGEHLAMGRGLWRRRAREGSGRVSLPGPGLHV